MSGEKTKEYVIAAMASVTLLILQFAIVYADLSQALKISLEIGLALLNVLCVANLYMRFKDERAALRWSVILPLFLAIYLVIGLMYDATFHWSSLLQ